VPVLVTVIVPVFVLLISVDATDKLLVLKLIAGSVAVLLKLTVLGLPLASCVIDSVADLLPVVVGENVTVSVHVSPAATLPEQPVTLKSAASVPVIAKLDTFRGAVPVFVTVIVPVLVLLMLTDPILRLLLLKLIAGASPVDDRAIVVAPLIELYALFVSVNVADLLPDVAGVKDTDSTQDVFAAKPLVQPDTLNSDAFVPVIAKLDIVSAAVPVFVTVTLLVVVEPTKVDSTLKLLVLVPIIAICACSSANGAVGGAKESVYLATPLVIRTSSI
jgi:hypothetical protein